MGVKRIPNKMNGQRFFSEYGYSIVLPNDWVKYDLEDEENTNGFFDASGWTGNLRITPLKVQVKNSETFIKNDILKNDFTELFWNEMKCYHFSEPSNDLYVYYWYLIESNKIYVCSFTIEYDENKESFATKTEIKKIEEILKRLQTN